jgi:hypothetical protein
MVYLRMARFGADGIADDAASQAIELRPVHSLD